MRARASDNCTFNRFKVFVSLHYSKLVKRLSDNQNVSGKSFFLYVSREPRGVFFYNLCETFLVQPKPTKFLFENLHALTMSSSCSVEVPHNLKLKENELPKTTPRSFNLFLLISLMSFLILKALALPISSLRCLCRRFKGVSLSHSSFVSNANVLSLNMKRFFPLFASHSKSHDGKVISVSVPFCSYSFLFEVIIFYDSFPKLFYHALESWCCGFSWFSRIPLEALRVAGKVSTANESLLGKLIEDWLVVTWMDKVRLRYLACGKSCFKFTSCEVRPTVSTNSPTRPFNKKELSENKTKKIEMGEKNYFNSFVLDMNDGKINKLSGNSILQT